MPTEPSDTHVATVRDVDVPHSPDGETFAREAAMLEEARAQAQAGLVVDAAVVRAWIDSIGTDHELPVPYPDR